MVRPRRGAYDAGMAIFLDDEAVALAGEDLETVLDSARQHLQADGRVVVEVRVDERSLSTEDLEQADQTPVAGREVRMYTADPRSLAVETLQQLRGQLEELRRLQEQAAERFQQDEATEALKQVGELVQIWLQTQQAVGHAAALLGVDLDQMGVDGRSVSEIANELAEKLRELKELLSAQDTVAIADTLLYEWPGIVDQWDRLVGRLIEAIEAGGQTPQ